MKTLITGLVTALAAALLVTVPAKAAGKQTYRYQPVAGVHEVKYFHGCWDSTDIEKRIKVDVIMEGLNFSDVTVHTQAHETGKPSTEMVTFRLRDRDASFKVQFRSEDGAHCQQGVQSIAFRDVVLHNAAQLNARR